MLVKNGNFHLNSQFLNVIKIHHLCFVPIHSNDFLFREGIPRFLNIKTCTNCINVQNLNRNNPFPCFYKKNNNFEVVAKKKKIKCKSKSIMFKSKT